MRDALEATTPWIVGEDPLRITEFLTRCQDRGWHHYPYLGNAAAAGIEMALWDIAGKHHGCPVNQFFGGLQTPDVPFYWFINVNDRDPETARAEAAEGVERGFGRSTSRSVSTSTTTSRSRADQGGGGR